MPVSACAWFYQNILASVIAPNLFENKFLSMLLAGTLGETQLCKNSRTLANIANECCDFKIYTRKV